MTNLPMRYIILAHPDIIEVILRECGFTYEELLDRVLTVCTLAYGNDALNEGAGE